ncbi:MULTISPECIES: LysE family translocator [unclassified Agarivorans]|uniref:LysE family translocator n=1 Tax=unclassified Agarivorans TaxID=2636026 RepID=UPI0026E25992|nr:MULTISPECIES: LysE family translocator [unclassified Agarivorans]MDO6687018.1 LysE family translocator [Agarivorans sp. 3_MG-2023]MDO6713570.1 LysE family translocator [Agarivorans sp. 2_MG-2023]
MLGINDFWLFVVSGILLNLIPGPDSLYVVARSASQGFKAGSVAAFGIGAGTFVHISAAAFGLSAILASSAAAFTVLKVVGCIYLLYMGLSMALRKEQSQPKTEPLCSTGYAKIFRQGFLTNSLNPKVALFFLAFVPQFIDAAEPNKALAFIVLGLVFNLNAMIWGHILAWLSASISHRVQTSQGAKRWLNRALGGVFAGFGLRLAFSELS